MSNNSDVAQKFYDMVPILENKDFDKDNKLILKNVADFTGKPVDTVLVMIYADWCPHCVHTKPHMVTAVEKLNKSNVVVASIPLAGEDIDKDLNGRLQAIIPSWGGGIPFIGKFKNNTVTEYKGGRNAEEIVNFALN